MGSTITRWKEDEECQKEQKDENNTTQRKSDYCFSSSDTAKNDKEKGENKDDSSLEIKPRSFWSPVRFKNKSSPFDTRNDNGHSKSSQNSDFSNDSFESVKRINREENSEQKNISAKIIERMNALNSNKNLSDSNNANLMFKSGFGHSSKQSTNLSPMSPNFMHIPTVRIIT